MDFHLALEIALSVIGGLATLWLKSIHVDFRELVKTVTNHGERIAVLESRLDRAGQ